MYLGTTFTLSVLDRKDGNLLMGAYDFGAHTCESWLEDDRGWIVARSSRGPQCTVVIYSDREAMYAALTHRLSDHPAPPEYRTHWMKWSGRRLPTIDDGGGLCGSVAEVLYQEGDPYPYTNIRTRSSRHWSVIEDAAEVPGHLQEIAHRVDRHIRFSLGMDGSFLS